MANETPGSTTHQAVAAQPRRADWIELLFDLAMAAVITQLASILHHPVGFEPFLTFVLWSIPAWWAWTSVMVCVNFQPVLPDRLVRLALFGATATVCLMAASVGNTTDRAWVFALANAALRLILLVLWGYRAHRDGWSILNTFLYNGITALIWIGSAFVPAPFNFVLWGVAILVEILLLRRDAGTASSGRVDLAHASERLGLFMMILVGESILSIVLSLSAHWSPESLLAALLGFVAIAFIAWNFFVSGISGFETGLRQLGQRRDGAGLLATVMVLPYFIAVSVTMLAAGLATVVENPGKPLPLESAICLDGGLALYFIATGLIVLRYGGRPGGVRAWLALGAVLPLLAIATVHWVDSLVSILIFAAIAILALTITSVLHSRSRAAAL